MKEIILSFKPNGECLTINIVMKYKELFETPISDIQYHGNFDHSLDRDGDSTSTYRSIDKKMVKKETYKTRLVKAFQKTPFKFEIAFVDLPKKNFSFDGVPGHHYDDLDFVNSLTDDGMKPIDGVYSKKKFGITPSPDVIKVAIISNLDGNDPIYGIQQFPLTPWIVAHKIGHSITEKNSKLSKPLKSLFYKFMMYTTEIGKKKEFGASDRLENHTEKVMNHLFTFKSARKIDNGSDMINELVAQYLIQGNIRFDLSSDLFTVQQKTKLKQMEEAFNECINKTLSVLNNHVLVAT